MASSEKFCLRWNDFETNISSAFREIREEKDFFDCTLSCGTRQIQAHKLILSACSPFFRSVLRQNPHQHPLLYLKGVEFNDLQAVLNFMYHGEVNVAQEELNSFLSVAEDLKVKGLTQNNATESPAAPKPKPFKSDPAPPSQTRPTVHKPMDEQSHASVPKPRQRLVVAPQPAHYQEQHDDDIQEVVPVVKQEPAAAEHVPVSLPVVPTMPQHHYQDPMGTAVASMDESYGDVGYEDYEQYEAEGYDEGAMMTGGTGADPNKGYINENNDGTNTEPKLDVEKYILSFEGKNQCSVCQKEFSQRAVCRRHIQTVHFGDQEQDCYICQKMFKNKPSLRSHLRTNHGIYTARK